ncbi:MAG: oligosaccharide flippase family protein [Candidatus Omnitrophota bacterium]
MRQKIKRLLKDDFILHTAIVFLGTTLVGVFNLLYHLVTVRLLSPEDYGTFNALVSFIMLTSMAISPLGTTLTRFFTEYIAKGNLATLFFSFKKLIKRLFIIAGVITGLCFAISPFLAGFLKTKILYVFICGGVIVLSLFSPPLISLFQSFQKFTVYSLLGITSSLGKLIFGGLLMLLGAKLLGALLGFLAGPVVIVLAALFFIPAILQKEMGHIDKTATLTVNLVPIYKYFFPVGVIMVSFTFLTTIDVILVKHFFSPLDAGYYSIAQMVGKIALFLPSALAIVILPKTTKAHVTEGSSIKLLYKSLFLAGVCCFFFTLFSFLFPDLLLTILTGKLNPISRELVGLFALAMSFYALTWIVINYSLATHNLKITLPLVLITALEIIIIYNCHPSLAMVLYILLIFGIISLFSSLLAVRATQKRIILPV